MQQTVIYRSDIDGLRAVAVLGVLIFHLDPSWLPGGFTGVDVFFVISGFLITGSIHSQVEAGRFSFADFYLRRVRRLLPALFAVLVATLVAGYLLLPASTMVQLGEETLAAGLSLSNIYFWMHSGYFDVAAHLRPLLHTWSLGVEEQFYLIWPALLVLLLRPATIRWVPALIAAAALVSIGFSEWLVRTDRSGTAFFWLPFRAYELGIGALVWFAVRRSRPAPVRVRQALPIAGLTLILVAMVGFDYTTPFPGLSALVPCLGAALLIYAGDTAFAGVLLRSRAAQYLGKISYSLYLVHWPLIVLYNGQLGREPAVWDKVLLGLSSIVLAMFLHHLVENRMRWAPARVPAGWGLTNGRFAMVFGAMAGLAVVSSMHAVATKGWPSRFQNDAMVQQLLKDREVRKTFRSSLTEPEFRAAVVGDSHSAHLYTALVERGDVENIAFDRHYLGPGCVPLLGISVLTPSGMHGKCERRRDAQLRRIIAGNYDLVVLVARWGLYTSDTLDRPAAQRRYLAADAGQPVSRDHEQSRRAFLIGLERTVAAFRQAGIRVLFVGQVPPLGRDLYPCIEKQVSLADVLEACRPVDFETALSESGWPTAQAMRESVRQGFAVFDPSTTLCDGGRCDAIRENRMLYVDVDHLSNAGAEVVTDGMMPLVLELLERSPMDQPPDRRAAVSH